VPTPLRDPSKINQVDLHAIPEIPFKICEKVGLEGPVTSPCLGEAREKAPDCCTRTECSAETPDDIHNGIGAPGCGPFQYTKLALAWNRAAVRVNILWPRLTSSRILEEALAAAVYEVGARR
jgi:hypothetical protein